MAARQLTSRDPIAVIPPGCGTLLLPLSGGGASAYHRLIAPNPYGINTATLRCGRSPTEPHEPTEGLPLRLPPAEGAGAFGWAVNDGHAKLNRYAVRETCGRTWGGVGDPRPASYKHPS